MNKLIVILLLVSAPSWGDESKWLHKEIEIAGASSSASALLTERGTLRLERMPEKISALMAVSQPSGIFKRSLNEKQMRKVCQGLRTDLEFVLEAKNEFVFEIPVIDFEDLNARIENPVKVQILPVIAFTDQSRPLMTAERLEMMQKSLREKFGSASPSDKTLTFTLAGVDDLACDLLTGQARLQAQVSVRFEAALLRRKEVFSAAQVRSVIEKLKILPVVEEGFDRMISTAANFGAVLNQELGAQYPILGPKKLVKLFNQLVQVSSGNLLTLDPPGIERAARQLDELSIGHDVNSISTQYSIQWGNL